jgi:hypothetical protein
MAMRQATGTADGLSLLKAAAPPVGWGIGGVARAVRNRNALPVCRFGRYKNIEFVIPATGRTRGCHDFPKLVPSLLA